MSRTALLLLKHVLDGNEEKVKDLLEAGNNANVVGPSRGMSPLHIACFRGHFQIAKMLIDSGAEVDERCNHSLQPWSSEGNCDFVNSIPDSGPRTTCCRGANGMTPLIIASCHGHQDLVELLLNRGAKADKCCWDKTNSLHFVCRVGHAGIASLLLKSGVKVNEKDGNGVTPLSTAIVHKYKELIVMLLKAGADSNEKSNSGWNPPLYDDSKTTNRLLLVQALCVNLGLKEKYSTELSPLSTAVCMGDYELVRLLVESGARLHDKEASLTPLHYACMRGNIEITTFLLESGAKVNDVTGRFKETPLHYACSRGIMEIVKILVQYKADLEAETSYGLKPYTCAGKNGYSALLEVLIDAGAKVDDKKHTSKLLHAACKDGDVDKVKKLWHAGANIDSEYCGYPTPLHYTGSTNLWEMMKLLIESGADVNKVDAHGTSPLHKHCAAGSADTVKLLLQNGAKVELNAGYSKDSPLHVVDDSEGDEIVKLLLGKGASVDKKNRNGETPLHKLCQRGNVQGVKTLLTAGANANEKDCDHKTPFHHACDWSKTSEITYDVDVEKRVETINILLKSGACINAHDKQNRTPMELACNHSHASLIEVILQAGVHVNTKLDGSRQPPLHHVIKSSSDCHQNRLEAIKVLLKYGGDMEMCNEEGLRPIHVANSFRNMEVIKILLDHGANINGTDGYGRTCLHHACKEGNMKVTKLLLERGANPNIPDKNGMSSLHYSRLNLYTGEMLMETLLDSGAEVNFQDTLGNTALHYVTYEEEKKYYFDIDDNIEDHEQIRFLKMLVDGGANVNLKNKLGEVPLQVHLKSETISYDLDTPRLFLEAGTDISALNIHGGSLNSYDSYEHITLFLDYGVGDLTCKCSSCPNDTPVLICAFNQLERGAYERPIYVKHTVKVVVAGLDTLKVQSLSPEDRNDHFQFRKNCETEIDRMKHDHIGDSNFSYYDLLQCQNSSSLRDKKLPWSLTSESCREKFRIYGDMIYSRFAPIKKKLLFDHCSPFFELTDLPRLPPECVIMVLEKLRYSDLSNVAEVCDAFHHQSNFETDTVCVHL